MAYVESIKTDSKSSKAAFKLTSSLNKYFLCHHCQKQFAKKKLLKVHVFECLSKRTCKWCNIEFKNHGNLVTHSIYVHNDKEYTNRTLAYACEGCDKSYCNFAGLTYHRRRDHFNLVTKIPLVDSKAVTEIWFEKVLNTDTIVEITKMRRNMLLIRKCNDSSVEVQESCQTLDLSLMYQTGKRRKMVNCDICKKEILSVAYKKHFEEKHSKIRKHQCNNCNRTFKRSYFFIRHQCNKKRKRGFRGSESIEISKVESLAAIPV